MDPENKPKTNEKLDSTLKKFLSAQPFDSDDITESAKQIFQELNQNYDHFKLVTISDDLDEILPKKRDPKTPIYAILEKLKQRWVVLCLWGDKAYYKDSSGEKIPHRIEKKFDTLTIFENFDQDHDADAVENYGPFSLRNLQILLKLGQEIGEKFPSQKFCQLADVDEEKVNIIVKNGQEFAQKNDFKNALRQFIETLPLDLGARMLKYKQILEEELDKDETLVDHERIKLARLEYLTDENVTKLQENYKVNDSSVEIEVVKQFPEEMDKLGQIFATLDHITDQKLRENALEQLAILLNLDANKLKSFYASKGPKTPLKKPQLTLDDISKIVDNLPKLDKTTKDAETTPFDQLLDQVTLGQDLTPSSPAQFTPNKSQLEQNYYQVKEKYQLWRGSTLHDINTWARSQKGKPGNFCEIVAVCDRVFALLTGGHRLRDTQILAVLLFNDVEKRGRLCQVQTGEGKTTIVSILAVVGALQGHLIDVVTTSPVLASDGVDKNRDFYAVFGLTVGTTDTPGGYTADVLYGSIASFQFDYLRESFEGLNVRNDRRFGLVILDEVDSLLVDNGGHIAKIATPYPGMESLRYVFIKIWAELAKAEERFIEENQSKLESIVTNDSAEQLFDEFWAQDERQVIRDLIKSAMPATSPLIPQHLSHYVARNLDDWIESALVAKYDCHELEQYRIVNGVVTPVDNLNTGVTLTNTVWSKGLQQFLQLKHNLHLTCSTLSSIFISNFGYIQKYAKIFGVTGTLGSTTEQDLLSHVYNVTFAKIPTHKPKSFTEEPPIVTKDNSWDLEVTSEIMRKIDEKRAVLVIFATERDLNTVGRNLEIIRHDDFEIRYIRHEGEVKDASLVVKASSVVLATNLAGRGCDFKTDQSVEERGGLHVIVAFLPANQRVEDQAFGRTSRNGNRGSGQLIVRESEASGGGLKQTRDLQERGRLKHVRDVLIKEIVFKEDLIGRFADLYLKLKRAKVLEGEFCYFLQDLKEFWAFWLDSRNFHMITQSVDEVFGEFLGEAEYIIKGEVKHNPFYSIALADHYLENNKKAKARSELLKVVSSGANHTELLAGAHLKMFELAIASGNQTWHKIRKALAKVLFIDVQKNTLYKKNALKQLGHANAAITTEIDFIESWLQSPDFERILPKDNFLKQVNSRLYCLKIQKGNIEELVKQIEEAGDDGVDFGGKAQSTVGNYRKMDKSSKEIVGETELSELQAVGIDALYTLRTVKDVPDYVIHAAQGQIGAGIAALAAGLFFPPIFPIMSPLGVTLISEGIIDIVFALFEDNPEFKDFMKGKAVSYGIALVTFGLSAIAQSIKIITKALSFFRKLATFLRKSSYLKGLSAKLAKVVDKLANKMERLLDVAKFNKLTRSQQLSQLKELQKSGKAFDHLGGLSKLQSLEKLQKLGKLKELTRSQLLVQFAKEVAWKTAEEGGKRLLEKFVIKPFLGRLYGDVIEKIKAFLVKSLKQSIQDNANLREKLRTTDKKQIDETLERFIKEDVVIEKLRDYLFDSLGKFKSTKFHVLIHGVKMAVNVGKMVHICTKFAANLEKQLKGGDADNNVDKIIDKICTKLVDEVLTICWDVLKDNVKFVWKHKDVFASKPTDLVLKPAEKTGNSWKVFGLEPGASLDEVKTHYRKMALVLHPDKNLNDPTATEKFQEFQNAYEDILKTF
ncbi:uncharacterized protein LOC103313326 [Tribolium castaneum]|uniref:Protein translocase subunit SecA n=1 Tax=Tribolium castaneum TaxID=7070 RepID=D2A4Q6_TRICA|nr:PREDICTED: uncharacterized protein LOC103313326 [Tribolium castaneum]EFA05253.1 hypothetical protein TcasGA2_TC015405 [Tribolium castaneum]|eukprot:XP_015836197.1 PREDICTED: uncharacterized protein LOC103313326 [Tribolium castaneum]